MLKPGPLCTISRERLRKMILKPTEQLYNELAAQISPIATLGELNAKCPIFCRLKYINSPAKFAGSIKACRTVEPADALLDPAIRSSIKTTR